MNVLQTPDFSNNDKIIAYARTFLHGIYSEDIRLLWVNHPDELPWSNNVDEETLETVVSVIQPPELIIRSKCFEVISTGIYGNGLYRFKLHITPEGNVNMVEDQLLADNLPLRRETFDGIVRVLSDLK